MIGIREWDIFKKNFPELAAEYKAFTIDTHHPHALKLTMRDGRELYFACGKTPFEYILTNDEAVKTFCDSAGNLRSDIFYKHLNGERCTAL